MDSRGQAYSTFKLLIAAIVAMAILAILIPIIMQVIGLIKADPTDETTSLLSSLIDQPGSLKHTKEVVFEPRDTLAASAIASKNPINKDQLCMSTGEFAGGPDEKFEWKESDTEDEQRILYHGDTDQQAIIAIVCNVNKKALLGDLAFYDLEYEEGNSIGNACEICEGKGKCCAIVLERS